MLCRHHFHAQCLQNLLEWGHNSAVDCPLCRERLNIQIVDSEIVPAEPKQPNPFLETMLSLGIDDTSALNIEALQEALATGRLEALHAITARLTARQAGRTGRFG